MTLAWLLPIGFAALTAALLPLLVHLARRSEHRITDFAALRWLSAKPQPRRRVRFDEVPLLLLRLLLIAAIAALLARPALFGAPDTRPWIVAAPQIDAGRLRDAARASGRTDMQVHWLMPGFPAMGATDTVAPRDAAASSTSPAQTATPSSLLRELDATLPTGTPMTVLVPATLDGVDGGRIRLSRAVDWRVVSDAASPVSQLPVSPTSTPLPAPIMVRHDPARAAALRYLRAAERAWAVDAAPPIQAAATNPPSNPAVDTTQRSTPSPPAVLRIATADVPLDPAIRTLVWLSPSPLPSAVGEWIAAGGHALVDVDTTLPATPTLSFEAGTWRDDDSAPLVRTAVMGRGRISQWTRRLSPAAMPMLLDASFPAGLRALLSDAPAAPARVDARAHAPDSAARPFPDAPRPLDGWLIAAIALLFAIERWMASGARRGSDAA